MIALAVRNESSRRWLYRRSRLEAIAARLIKGEKLVRRGGTVEVSLLFCDDPFICALNQQYRNVPRPTDVLSFEQENSVEGAVRILGDIVISLETVERRNRDDRDAMRQEVQLLFCHGLLHLAGYDHRTKLERERMHTLQAAYLNCNLDAAWLSEPSYQPLTGTG